MSVDCINLPVRNVNYCCFPYAHIFMQAKVLLDVSVVFFSSHILNSTATLVSILSSWGEFTRLIVCRVFWGSVSHA